MTSPSEGARAEAVREAMMRVQTTKRQLLKEMDDLISHIQIVVPEDQRRRSVALMNIEQGVLWAIRAIENELAEASKEGRVPRIATPLRRD